MDILEDMGFPLRLPELAEVGETVGTLQRQLAGLKRGTQVVAAMGDMQVRQYLHL